MVFRGVGQPYTPPWRWPETGQLHNTPDGVELVLSIAAIGDWEVRDVRRGHAGSTRSRTNGHVGGILGTSFTLSSPVADQSVKERLNKLPAPRLLPDNDVLVQMRHQGATYAEIAQTYGVSEQAVYNRLRQARAVTPTPRHRDLLPWTVKREHTFALDAQVLRLLSREARDGREAIPASKRGMVDNWLRRLREEDAVVCYDRERGFFHAPRTPADGESLIRPEGVETTDSIDERHGEKIREAIAVRDREVAAERAGATPPPRNRFEMQTQDESRVSLSASQNARGHFLLVVEGGDATEVTLDRADLLRLIEHAARLLAQAE